MKQTAGAQKAESSERRWRSRDKQSRSSSEIQRNMSKQKNSSSLKRSRHFRETLRERWSDKNEK